MEINQAQALQFPVLHRNGKAYRLDGVEIIYNGPLPPRKYEKYIYAIDELSIQEKQFLLRHFLLMRSRIKKSEEKVDELKNMFVTAYDGYDKLFDEWGRQEPPYYIF